VLDVAPVLPASKAQPSRSGETVIAQRGWNRVADLELLTGERRAPTLGRWVVSSEALAAVRDRLRVAVESAGPLGVDMAGFDEREREVLATLEEVAIEGGRARPRAAQDPLAAHPYLAALRAGGFSPPEPEGVGRVELRELVRRGLVVERDGCYFAADTVDAAARVVASLLDVSPEGVTVAQVRDALGTTRKHALPLLAHLDASGVTRRRGDVRIAGPLLPG
jgi:selenocysteine-specific elongation factor